MQKLQKCTKSAVVEGILSSLEMNRSNAVCWRFQICFRCSSHHSLFNRRNPTFVSFLVIRGTEHLKSDPVTYNAREEKDPNDFGYPLYQRRINKNIRQSAVHPKSNQFL